MKLVGMIAGLTLLAAGTISSGGFGKLSYEGRVGEYNMYKMETDTPNTDTELKEARAGALKISFESMHEEATGYIADILGLDLCMTYLEYVEFSGNLNNSLSNKISELRDLTSKTLETLDLICKKSEKYIQKLTAGEIYSIDEKVLSYYNMMLSGAELEVSVCNDSVNKFIRAHSGEELKFKEEKIKYNLDSPEVFAKFRQ